MSKRSILVLAVVLVISGFVLINDGDNDLDGIELPTEISSPGEGEVDLKNDQMPGYGLFIENKGQWDEDILFLASTDFGHIGLGKDCVFFDLREIKEKEIEMERAFDIYQPIEMEEEKVELDITGYVVKYTFEGAKDIEPIGADPLVQTNNYFIGNDPSKWARGVRTFESVIYKDLYEKVDLKYYFNENGPKYDFILNPGAEPDDIEIKVEGHESLEMEENGMSILLPNGRLLSDSGLISFHEGQSNSAIETDFNFIDGDTIKFDLDEYDTSRKVIIDPLIFCTYIGTNDYEHFAKFKIGRNDRIYFTAVSISSNFPTSPGAYDDTHHTGRDNVAFFMDPDASEILNATYIGGDSEEWGTTFFLDDDENFIMFGQTDSTDYPTTFGAFQTTYGGGRDLLLMKLLNNCTDLVFSTYIGGSEIDQGNIILDSNEDIYVSGNTNSSDFPTTIGVYDRTFNGGYMDGFVMKIKSDGSDAIFSTYLGGNSDDATAIRQIDPMGDLIIVGSTRSDNFPTSSGSYDTTINGGEDCYFLKMKSDGSDIIFSTFIGGGAREIVNGVEFDSNGNIIICGITQSSDFPTTVGAFNRTYQGSYDIYALKMKIDGTDILYSTYLGEVGDDRFGNMHIGDNDDIIITGTTKSADFPTTSGAYDTTYNDQGTNTDIYLLKMKNDFSDLIFSTFIGGRAGDSASIVKIDDYGNIFLSGGTHSSDFPTTEDAIDDTYGNSGDPVFLQMSYDGSELMYSTYLGGNSEEGASFFIDDYGTVYGGGITTSTDLPTTPGGFSDNFMGSYDIYLYKFTIEVNTEPTEIYSVEAYSEPDFTGQIAMVEKDQTIFVELLGLDGNATHRDTTLVEIDFRWSPINLINLPLRETDFNTGIYRGEFTIPAGIDYFEEITITSKKDPTKWDKLYVDSPFRPVSVSDLEIFSNPSYLTGGDIFDLEDTAYVEVIGEDASAITQDFAFVNITSDKNLTFLMMMRVEETGLNTGIYRGSFDIPTRFDYYENITMYSVRNHDKSDSFMVHTPLQIRPLEDILEAKEDEEYRSPSYWNFGYETATWSLQTLANWLQWDNDNSEIYGTPDNNHVGDWDVMLTTEDGKGHSDIHEFQITVENAPPSILTEDVTTAREGELYEVDYSCDDDGQGDVTWAMISYSTWLTIDTATGVLSGIPYHTDIGIHPITIIVKDGHGGENRSAFEIDVQGFNRPPEIRSLDITTATQEELYFRDYDAHDPNEYDILEWFLDTNASSFLSIENDTGILTGTPGAEDYGVFYVNVTVKDQDGLMDSHIFDLTVENINDMPYWDSVPEDLDILHGKHFIFDVNALDYDPGSNLKYSIRSKPESNISIDPDTGEIDWITSVVWFDEEPFRIDITIEVSDGELFRSHKFTLTILPTESPTVELSGPEDGKKTPSSNTVLEWEGSDPENEPITYDIFIHESQAFIDGLREEALHLEGYEGESYTISGLTLGKMYYWTIRPHDGCSYGICTDGRRSFILNNPPIMNNIPNQEISSGSEFKFRVTTSDDDDQDKGNLVHTLVNSPEGMRISEDTGTIRWTPNNDQAGYHTITVGVSDGVETTIKTFDIEVIGSEESEFPIMVVVAVAGVIVLIIIAVLVFLLIKKREPKEKKEKEEEIDEETAEIMKQMEDHKKEEQWEKGDLDHKDDNTSNVPLSASEAHEHDKDRRHDSLSYKDLYGTEAPEIEEGDVTTEELRDTIKESADKLEQMEPPKEEEEDNFLDSLISHAHKETHDIETRNQDLISVENELRAVEDPYENQGASEEDIEK